MKATTPASRSSVDTADSRAATASALRRKLGLAVMAVAASLVLMAGNGDQWLADQIYRWEGSRWAFKDAWWTTHVIHRGGKNLSTLAGVLVMLALPVGIIATAFAEVIHRRDFVVTWNMVARVPLPAWCCKAPWNCPRRPQSCSAPPWPAWCSRCWWALARRSGPAKPWPAC